jgi:hypothetical protein
MGVRAFAAHSRVLRVLPPLFGAVSRIESTAHLTGASLVVETHVKSISYVYVRVGTSIKHNQSVNHYLH